MPKFKVNTNKGNSFFLKDENEIHRGGEGRILLIDKQKDMVAKIYHKGIKPITEERFNILQKLDKSLFLIPQDLIFQDNNIIGYTMQYAGKDFFPLSSCFSKSFCLRMKMTGKTAKIAKSLIGAVKTAHKNSIVIGDLNQFNVLVNTQGDIKLIDTDSYKTPGFAHSGLLLDEIRDYLYQGIVSESSDYFALSVLLFYLFSYTHPFKGIHQKYKKISDRMIHKIPVFANDPLLKVPKCYQALRDGALQADFDRLYLKGERFMLSFSGSGASPVKPSATKIPPLKRFSEDELIVSPIIQNENILDVLFNQSMGYVETETQFIVYSSANKAYVSRKFKISKTDYDAVYLTEKNVLLQKDGSLYHYKNDRDIVQISNFQIPENTVVYQSGNVLMVIGENQMYKLYLDELRNSSITNKRIEVFGPAFSHHNGLIQNVGGVQRIFYNTGKDIATVKADKNIKMMYQKANIGMMQTVENKKLTNYYFKIKGLSLEIAATQLEMFGHFAFMPTTDGEGFIFEPKDNKIIVRRTQDFKIISEIKSNTISAQSSLSYTQSGIIVWEDNSVYLLNKKNA